MVSSYWLAILFQANHVVENVKWPIPEKDKSMKIDWAEMQVGKLFIRILLIFLNFFTIALNHSQKIYKNVLNLLFLGFNFARLCSWK